MKNKIRQILREETSGFDPKELEQLYRFINHLTKDYVWYYDTPENRFEYVPETIWLINPKKEKWALFLKKDGALRWYLRFYFNFRRYFNMEIPDFERFIKIWVKDVLNRGVSSTTESNGTLELSVKDVLNRGVSSTPSDFAPWSKEVKDVLNRGKQLK